MNKGISKYLLILICGCLLFTACRVLEATWEIPKAIGESLGIIEPEEKTEEKVVNGKVVKVNSNGVVVTTSNKGRKINVGYLVWWAAVFTAIALGIRYYIKWRHE